MGSLSWGLLAVGLAAAVLVMAAQFAVGTTDPRDVSAINGLYSSLGSPPLVGWTSAGGDPCGELWQGVNCMFSNITELDFGNNHIGGTIPSSLPPTVRNLSLSGNHLKGSIPASLSALTQLLQLSLNDNHLSEEILDSFQNLKSLISLDLSGNNLSGQLPPSLGLVKLAPDGEKSVATRLAGTFGYLAPEYAD